MSSIKHNLTTSAKKLKITAFIIYPLMCKIVNDILLEQISQVIKTVRFQNICSTISRSLSRKACKEIQINYKIMVVPALLYLECWHPREKDLRALQRAEIKFLQAIKGCMI